MSLNKLLNLNFYIIKIKYWQYFNEFDHYRFLTLIMPDIVIFGNFKRFVIKDLVKELKFCTRALFREIFLKLFIEKNLFLFKKSLSFSIIFR